MRFLSLVIKQVFHVKWVCLIVLFCMTTNHYAQTMIELPVVDADGGDDAEERFTSGNMLIGSYDLDLCTDVNNGGDRQYVGIRFQNVNIPVGAEITNAYIQFMANAADANDVQIGVAGVASSNASIFTSTNGDITSRPLTTNNVIWSPPNWDTVSEKGPAQQTPDLKDIVQEIIDMGGWSSGNAMSFVFSPVGGSPNTRRAYDGDNASQTPTLHIEFLEPGLNVIGNGVTIKNNDVTPHTKDLTHFGNTTEGSPVQHTFTITNTGSISSLSSFIFFR